MMTLIMHRLHIALQGAWPALLIVGIVAAAQIFLITRPLEYLLTNILPDDAFYYFEIARQIVLGSGSTFDGLAATNGYHPLWMLVLLPFFAVFGADVGGLEPIRAALALSVLLNAATGLLVWLILGRFTTNVFVRTLGLAIWALNPFLLYQGVNGLETSLSLFFVALLFWQALKIEEKMAAQGQVTLLNLVAFGLIGGLCILARLDTAVYVGAILLWVWLREMSRQSFKQAVLAGIVVFVCVAPWLLWNVTNFGMLTTSSSGANMLVNHTLIFQDNGTGVYQAIKGEFYMIHGHISALMLRTSAPGLAYMLFGSALALFSIGAWTIPRRLRDIPVAYSFALGFALLFFLNVAVRWTGGRWYFVSFGILVAILAAVVIDTIRGRWPFRERTKQLAALALTGLIAFLFFTWWHKELTDPAVQQREMYATALWLDDNLPDARVGVFNAGIIGYFSHADVINLDGLVNNDAYRAMKEQRLYEYLHDAGITHLADFPIYLTYRYRSFWGVPDITEHLEELQTVFLGGHSRSGDGLHIYKVK
ncbi:hypothetical protein A2763_01685 [Candidatus Kaiserbacteria bacterium RIFCSPHIGHO2_01_FULL_54_36]|uniref:Glycosyltransferase RgtA/B/C/D-like domain-containing protein n=1 Tax=Candidatus Kaiserbacteria bacterium RIFCSPHIGHO2_01_FULL_54_36 TaxID=1798482 RepID=A0A1F6CMM4_9BACT|nr:MAG: hypothetical protein A2763_01685 [Candidatus Kaiserbacteria bacterium RIFCSPHIGHO2_01_FULL_54_36]OGG75831.1 MAG: hypothetical protein A3A41_02720 [Candidatus Kaiserbacteria bacterium RIFCSPLOWO2_01_FULL_54_22]